MIVLLRFVAWFHPGRIAQTVFMSTLGIPYICVLNIRLLYPLSLLCNADDFDELVFACYSCKCINFFLCTVAY